MASPKFLPGGPSGRHFNSNSSSLAASIGADFAVVGILRGERTVSHATLSVASAGVEFLKHNRTQTQLCVGTQTLEGMEGFMYISWSYE